MRLFDVGFLVMGGFFDWGFLAEGKLLKGELLKGKELLKKNCLRRIAKGELLKLKREHGTVQVRTENFIHKL
jgi:hypothetical protein